ncbi:hypothetical protein FRX31_010948 [Thalictrum thalictroides]|uniref:Uncharacterized protein n=1 Tax=Thalictrum thalictroides TaxID=46969 RepID=A0A7J6WSM6_THATH|nr:hypothetical protein FRX31_010948 [Thalictrum thalictroides]
MSSAACCPNSLQQPSQHKMITNFLPASSSSLIGFSHRNPFYCSNLKLKSSSLTIGFAKLSVKCSSSNKPPGEADSKDVLDAFFLGKALAEAINERIESTVGELLSVVGRLQAEQQKQIQDFQEDVLERAKREKEKASREALEAQGFVPKSTAVAVNVAPPAVSRSDATNVTPYRPASSSDSDTTTGNNGSTTEDPFLRMLKDD